MTEEDSLLGWTSLSGACSSRLVSPKWTKGTLKDLGVDVYIYCKTRRVFSKTTASQALVAAAATVWSSALKNALNDDFVYCDNWKKRRHTMEEWHRLELLISTLAIGHFESNTVATPS